MAETKNTLNIFQKLAKIQSELKAPKNLFNKFGGYYYRNAESICEAVKPFEVKYGVALFITDSIEQIGDRYYVVATATLFDCDSDKTISVSARAREPENKKGQDDAQITGATSSYARKYALNGLFLLDDTKDADTDEYHEQTNAKTEATPNKVVKKQEPKTDEDMKYRKKLQREFVSYCNENGIDYKKYNLKQDSPTIEFEKAYNKAIGEVTTRNGDKLPFPMSDDEEN